MSNNRSNSLGGRKSLNQLIKRTEVRVVPAAYNKAGGLIRESFEKTIVVTDRTIFHNRNTMKEATRWGVKAALAKKSAGL